MPQTKEERKAYLREYYAKNKAKLTLQRKEHYQNNKEKIALRTKKYREENIDKYRIKAWKKQGIIDGYFDLLNEVFKKETHCWICWEPYNGTKRRKCLDHDWDIKDDSNPRYICCNVCNLKVVG